MRTKTVKYGYGAVLGGIVALLCLPAGALAHSGVWAKFNYCPSTTTGVHKCLYSVTNGGEIILGKKTTPIVNPVTLQGGYSEENEVGNATFFAATNNETLSKTPQPVPGGLLGIVPPESSPPLVKLLSKFFFENSLTGVNATLELAKPASEIVLNEFNLLVGGGVALKLPVKVHLENPFLGSSCYVGSSSSPIIWNLTTGTTEPKSPNKPITGKPGFPEVKEEYELVQITENSLVENNWSAPSATGCGGVLSFLVDPVINAELGLPAAAGTNTSILNNTIDSATAYSVNHH
jgi:hypothetical protein